jgi:maltooligosyltrehalose trehalohydrolase
MLHNIEKRTIGLNFSTATSASILVWAPFAESISIEISDNQVPLKRSEFGYWENELTDIHTGDMYHIINDGKTFPDPASLSQPEGVHGSSQAFNLKSFAWSDNAWKGISPEDLIIYELHTATFSESGSFGGIAEKLEYLKDLGITAIEIMPVAQFPGSRNWGYDGVFPFAVQNSYGGAEGLQKLVDTCHKHNIAVILDVVYNHSGPEGNYLTAFGPYFTEKYKTPWGRAINFDHEWCDGVRRFFIENALMWMRDFHIDGLRLDAVHAIKDFGAKHILEELKENVNKLNDLDKGSHFLIAESDLNDVRYLNTQDIGGYGMDMQWCDEFHHSIHALVTGERDGYYSDFGSISHICKSFNDAFVYTDTYSHFRKKTFGSDTCDLPGSKFVVFMQNHDQIGNRMLGDRLSLLVDTETLKLIAGATFFSPFIPLIFMGEEYGGKNPFLYFTSHEDKGLIRDVLEGRKREFASFAGKGEMPDPQSVETFDKSKLDWGKHRAEQQNLFSFYKEIIRIRKCHPVLKNFDRKEIEAKVSGDNNTIILRRKYGQNIIFCIMNFEDGTVNLQLEDIKKPLFILLNSSGDNWSNSRNLSLVDKQVNLNAKSILLLSDVKV